jgi:serine protease Do
VINNNTNETICYVRFSPTTDEYWGDDQLGSSEVIDPGGSRTWSVAPNTYDLRVDDCSQEEIETMWGANIATSYTWNVTGSGGGAPPPPPPTSSGSSGGLDWTQSPNFGSVNLSAGFAPDPQTVAMVSGGSVDVWSQSLGAGCTGYATSAPDYRINWSGSTSRLRIFFVGEGGEDTTLIVNEASGSWNCSDDYSGFDPMVELNNPASGQIDIWVGSYGSGEFVNGTLYITELSYDPSDFQGGSQGQPPPPPPSGGLDYTQSPNYGSASLSAGFSPDPYTVGMTSGGSVDVYSEGLGSGCTGYATSAPDFRLQWSGSSSRLRIFFVPSGSDDTTLVVNTAGGQWRCNDDYSGLDPLVELTNPSPGQYDIWVGSYSSGDYVAGTLYITELTFDPSDF